MCQAVLSPNLTKKFQLEVSQIANNRFPRPMLLGGLSVNLNHLKISPFYWRDICLTYLSVSTAITLLIVY